MMKIILLAFASSLVCAWSAAAQDASASPVALRHKLHFAPGPAGEATIVVDKQQTLVTVAALKSYLTTLPAGSVVVLKQTDRKFVGGDPFSAALADLQKFCEDRGIKFVVNPPGYL